MSDTQPTMVDNGARIMVALTADELHTLICAMAGVTPARLEPLRTPLLHALARAWYLLGDGPGSLPVKARGDYRRHDDGIIGLGPV